MITKIFTKFLGRDFAESHWIYLGDFSIQLFGFLLFLVLSRTLTLQELGWLILVVAIGDFIFLCSEIKLADIITRFLKMALHEKDPKIAWQLILWGFKWNIIGNCLLFLLLYFAAPRVLVLITPFQSLAPFMKIYALLALTRIGVQTSLGILQALGEFKIIGITGFLQALLRFSLAAILSVFGISGALYGFVGASFLFAIAILTLAILMMTRRCAFVFQRPSIPHVWRKDLAQMLLHVWTSLSLKGMLNYVDIVLLGIFSTSASVALYRIAKTGAQMVTSLALPMAFVIYPQLVTHAIHKQYSELKLLIRAYIKNSILLLVPTVVLLFLAADMIYGAFFPDSYLPGVIIFRIMLIGSLAISMVQWADGFVFAIGKAHYSTLWNGVHLACLLSLFISIVPLYNLVGAGITFASIQIFITVFIYLICLKRLRALDESTTIVAV